MTIIMDGYLCTWFISIYLLSYAVPSVSESGYEPEDGVWSGWMEWTGCSVTCGFGYHVRSRVCDTNVTISDNCTGDDFEVTSCQLNDCPVDGGWGTWLSWLPCSLTCGTGVQYRNRKCDSPVPSNGGAECVGKQQDFGTCTKTQCPVNGKWTNWGEFGPCSQTCGTDAFKERERNCSNPEPAFGGDDCDGNSTDIQACDFIDCKDGIWEEWESWGECSKTCGTSIQLRNRFCQMSTTNGTCPGNYYEFKSCNSPCPVDGHWSIWTDWSRCSASCEDGTEKRQRQCSNPSPVNGGKNCTGDDIETRSCFVSVVCPIDGNWAAWQSWSRCDQTCGSGSRVRLRTCSNPAPKYNGTDCPGDIIDKESCTTELCPLDGQWTDWYSWGACSLTCGTGVRSRLRLCANPKPVNGGLFCVGDFEEQRNCSNNASCPVDGAWASWAAWGGCSATCGTGSYSRNRTCSNPAPHDGGLPCTGNSTDYGTCTVDTSCPLDGGWAAWRDLTPCSVSCDNGTQTRGRTCTNPKPQFGGNYCSGSNTLDDDCVLAPCDDSGLTEVVG